MRHDGFRFISLSFDGVMFQPRNVSLRNKCNTRSIFNLNHNFSVLKVFSYFLNRLDYVIYLHIIIKVV